MIRRYLTNCWTRPRTRTPTSARSSRTARIAPKEQEARLQADGIDSHVCEKGSRGKPLTEEQKAANHKKSRTRSRIEHVFGAQAQMGGHLVRTIGIARARVKIALMNLAYNMRRCVLLCKRQIQATNGVDRRGASAAA